MTSDDTATQNNQGSASITGAKWRKSSLSMSNSHCVEVARLRGYVGIRDSKDRNGPILLFTPDVWSAFIRDVHRGKFDTVP
jgi:Domain of unknown function (DUF397)